MLTLWLPSHVMMDTLCLDPAQVFVRVLEVERGINKFQHVFKMMTWKIEEISKKDLSKLSVLYLIPQLCNEMKMKKVVKLYQFKLPLCIH